MRILWLSRAPWSTGGYSNQTALFVPRLAAAGHEIAIVGLQGISSGMLDWQGVPVYPMLNNDLRSTTLLGLHYQDWQADLMVSLHDTEKGVDGPALRKRFPGLRWALWVPIHSAPLSDLEQRRLRAVSLPLAMSRFGERVAREHGLDLRYVPHGVDTRVFAPRERGALRAELGWPADAFVAGMVAANNGTRKAFPQHIEAFARFHRRHPDSMLYLQTLEVAPGGLDLSAICLDAGLKVGRDVVFADPYRYLLGMRDERMAGLYGAMDALLMVTKGEGFGLPIIEAQACGTPVVLGDWSAMPELCFAGWKVRRDESTKVENNWYLASAEAIAARLEEAYLVSRHPERCRELRRKAREGALGYDVDRVVAEYWVPFLDEVGRSLGGDRREVSPSKPESRSPGAGRAGESG